MKSQSNSLWRIALALVAVLAIAGPGLVYAGNITGYPAPRTAQILGPGSVSPNGTGSYSLLVQFVGGQQSTFIAPAVAWSATGGTFTGNTFMAGTGPKALLTGKLTSTGVTVTSNRAILVQ